MSAVINRRSFLRTSLLGLAGGHGLSQVSHSAPTLQGTAREASIIIDTHTHFYDPARPQGVPWPPKEDKALYRTVLPKDYISLPKPQPVRGTVVVEASPWVEDNLWVLDLAAQEPFIVGFVGNLPIGEEEFRRHLTPLQTHRVFRGLRVRADKLKQGWGEARFVADLKLLAERDLSLDVVGGPEILEFVPKIAGEIPSLRMIIDHLAGVRIDGKAPPTRWRAAMEAAATHGNVFCKVSGLVEGSGQRNGKAPRELDFYKPTLDVVWTLFGPTRLIYGSNWPVCEHYADLATVERLAIEYFTPKGIDTLNAIFWRNAQRAYKWVRRDRRAR